MHYERELTGNWTSNGFQLIFDGAPENNRARFAGPANTPAEYMSYTLREVDGEWWIKFQNETGERNFRIIRLSESELIMKNESETIHLKRVGL